MQAPDGSDNSCGPHLTSLLPALRNQRMVVSRWLALLVIAGEGRK
jgi:hypothetical protein